MEETEIILVDVIVKIKIRVITIGLIGYHRAGHAWHEMAKVCLIHISISVKIAQNSRRTAIIVDLDAGNRTRTIIATVNNAIVV